HRTVVVDGLVAGFWEVDPASGGGVWASFDPQPAKVKAAIDAAVADTARFLLSDIGHARAFSLDTMEEVQRRADAIKSGKALGMTNVTRKSARPAAAAANKAVAKKQKKS